MKNTDYQILISQDNEPKIFTDIFPPVKDYIPIEEPGDILPPDKLLSNFYTGSVLDKTSGEPLQGASVFLLSGNTPIASQQTNNKGFFEFDSDVDATTIQISHASYKPTAVKAAIYNNSGFYIVEMERDEKILPPVELPGGAPKQSYWWLLITAAIILNEASKKKVGKIDMSTLLVIGAGGVMLLGFDTIKKLLESVGLWDDKDTKDFDDQIQNPDSFWNPLFWQRGPDGTLVLTNDFCVWLYDEIYNSFGVLNDSEARIYAAFKKMKTQSQLSYFSWWVQKNKGTDLLEWLKGGKYGPVGDHLSVAEIAVITNYFNGLTKYKA